MRPLKRKFSQDQDCKQEIKQTIVPQCTDDKPKIRIKSQKPGFVTKRNNFNLNIITYVYYKTNKVFLKKFSLVIKCTKH